jgi:hypothetical protein
MRVGERLQAEGKVADGRDRARGRRGRCRRGQSGGGPPTAAECDGGRAGGRGIGILVALGLERRGTAAFENGGREGRRTGGRAG